MRFTSNRRMPVRKRWLIVGILAGAGLGACASSAAAPAPATGAKTAAAPLVLQADTVLGSKNLAKTEKSCVQSSQYARNEQIVWRVRVLDGANGKALDDKALSTVELKLPDQTLKLHYAGHPKTDPTDSFWATSWTIPADYPTGTLTYSIDATALDGRTGSFQQFNVAPALLTITQDVHPVAAGS